MHDWQFTMTESEFFWVVAFVAVQAIGAGYILGRAFGRLWVGIIGGLILGAAAFPLAIYLSYLARFPA